METDVQGEETGGEHEQSGPEEGARENTDGGEDEAINGEQDEASVSEAEAGVKMEAEAEAGVKMETESKGASDKNQIQAADGSGKEGAAAQDVAQGASATENASAAVSMGATVEAAEADMHVQIVGAAAPVAEVAGAAAGGSSESTGEVGKGTEVSAKEVAAIDVASLGKGGGLMGDDDHVFVPQVAPAPSLSQYTAKAKEASSKVELNKYDVDAWKVLVSEVQTGAMKHLAGEVYERLLEVFPTSGRHWLSYANTFVADNNKAQAIAVLERALPQCPHVDLWRAFLIHFVGLTKDSGEVGKAYEGAVECIGQDMAANAVWNDYIAFLKKSIAGNRYEKGMAMNQLRRAYQRALLVPMHQMERLWSDYEEWEKSVDPTNPTATETLIRDWEPKVLAPRSYCHAFFLLRLPFAHYLRMAQAAPTTCRHMRACSHAYANMLACCC